MNFQSLIIIDSKDRVNGVPENFNFQPKFYGPEGVRSYRVNKVNIPYSFYNLKTQTFSINGTQLTLPAGSYSAQSLATKLTSLITPHVVISISYLTDTNKYLFSAAVPIQFDFTTATVAINYSLQRALGFPNVLSPSGLSIESVNCVNLNASTNIYISSQALSLNVPSIFNAMRSYVIQSVPIQVNSFNYIVWQNNLETVYSLQKDNLDNIDLVLYDDYGAQIDLNGLDWTIELQCNSQILN